MDKLISVKEAAVRLGCSEASVWRWLEQGRLQKVKVGSLTRISEQDIDACPGRVA
jgi:excisionase family DNA binding protein